MDRWSQHVSFKILVTLVLPLSKFLVTFNSRKEPGWNVPESPKSDRHTHDRGSKSRGELSHQHKATKQPERGFETFLPWVKSDLLPFCESSPVEEHLDAFVQVSSREWFGTRVSDSLGSCRCHGYSVAGHGWLWNFLGLVYSFGQRQHSLSFELGTNSGCIASATHGISTVLILFGRTRRHRIQKTPRIPCRDVEIWERSLRCLSKVYHSKISMMKTSCNHNWCDFSSYGVSMYLAKCWIVTLPMTNARFGCVQTAAHHLTQ